MRKVRKDEINNNTIYAQIYLQDIHIFAISNLLRRPIIVLGLPVVREVTPSFIRGIYLPLLNNPIDCIKEPIIITFHDFHFCPLVYVFNKTDNEKNLKSSGVIGDVFRDETIFEIEEDVNNLGKKRTHNYIPLVYPNFESMKIHFLKPDEEKKASKLLEVYFKTGFVKVSNVGEGEEPIHVLAVKCFTNLGLNNSCIDVFCDFANDSFNHNKGKNFLKIITTW